MILLVKIFERAVLSSQVFGFEKWHENLRLCIEWIKNNSKAPRQKGSDIKIEELNLGIWLSAQRVNFRKNRYIMSNIEIRKIWTLMCEEYKLLDNTDREKKWREKLEQCIEFLKRNGRSPSQSKDLKTFESNLARWITLQGQNYRKNIGIMSILEIRITWENIQKIYPDLCQDREEKWKNKLEDLIEYVKNNNRVPRQSGNERDEIEKELSEFLAIQRKNHKSGEFERIGINRKEIWENLINTYPELDEVNREEIWKSKLNKLEEYIKTYNKLPRKSGNDRDQVEKELGNFITLQIRNYEESKYIMSNPNIRLLWEIFYKTHENLLLSKEEIWKKKINECISYIKINNRAPRQTGENRSDIEKELGNFIRIYRVNYDKKYGIMQNPEIRKLWYDACVSYQQLCGDGKYSLNEEKDKPQNKNLNLMSMIELKSIAKSLKIKGVSRYNKENREKLIELIKINQTN